MLSEMLMSLLERYLTTVSSSVNREYFIFSKHMERSLSESTFTFDGFIEATSQNNTNRVNLCTFSRTLENAKYSDTSMIELIYNNLRHLILIFMHPRLHLKELIQILPVEAVKSISKESINHLAAHSEHWAYKRIFNPVPSRLLAKSLEDEYAIYENIVAKNLVDKIYVYARRLMKELMRIELYYEAKECIYTLSGLQSNVSRAYASLFEGYSFMDDDDFRERNEEHIRMLEKIVSGLALCRESRLYRTLRKLPKMTGVIKPTNIFLMDKHYKHVYALWNALRGRFAQMNENITDDNDYEITSEFFEFVYCALMFALKHSNFEPVNGSSPIWEFGSVTRQEFICARHWKCTIDSFNFAALDCDGISLTMSINKEHIFTAEETDIPSLIGLPACLEGTCLTVSRVLNPDEIDQVCAALYPISQINYGGLDKNGKIVYRNKKTARSELKKNMLEYFSKTNETTRKILLLPLYAKFTDCTVDAANALSVMFKELSNELDLNDFYAVYIITPFSAFDYERSDNVSQEDAKQLLQYASCEHFNGQRAVLPVSIADINSFRRLSKLLLLSMVSPEDGLVICPVCNEKMVESGNERDVLLCRSCQYEIVHVRCPDCKRKYLKSKFKTTSNIIKTDNRSAAYSLLVLEMENGYKNLTDIDINNNRDICPFCNRDKYLQSFE